MPAPNVTPDPPPEQLATPAGDVPLAEYRLRLAGREWGVLHTASVWSFWDEQRFLSEERDRLPYGIVLWPAAVALAHDVAARGDALHGRAVLELGAGTGLPGIVAATMGARVVQTDRNELTLQVCQRNGTRNGVGGGSAAAIEYRLADWAAWDDARRYDVILGADVMYGEAMHPHLRRILADNLAPGGRVLLADPFRSAALRLLEVMEADGWTVAVTKWSVGEDAVDADPRPIGVFELTPPASGGGAKARHDAT